MPPVPSDSAGQEQEYHSPVHVGKERDQGSLRFEPLKPCARGKKCKAKFYRAEPAQTTQKLRAFLRKGSSSPVPQTGIPAGGQLVPGVGD